MQKLSCEDLKVAIKHLIEQNRRSPVLITGDDAALAMARATLAEIGINLLNTNVKVETEGELQGQPLIAACAIYGYGDRPMFFGAASSTLQIGYGMINTAVANRCVHIPV